jgi:hypothetical protein
MKFKCFAVILPILITSSCNQSASPPPELSQQGAPGGSPAAAPKAAQGTGGPTPQQPAAGSTRKGTQLEPVPRQITPQAQAKLKDLDKEFGRGTKLPDGFPSDVSIYAGTKITASGRMSEDVMVNLVTSDRPDQIVEFYRMDLVKRGWKVQPVRFGGGIVEAQKSGRHCTVTADLDASGEGTIIGITVTPEKKK